MAADQLRRTGNRLRALALPVVLTIVFGGLLLIILRHDTLIRTAAIVAAIGLLVVIPLPRVTWQPAAVVIALGFLLISPYFLTKVQVDRLTDYMVYAMAAISLNMLIGMSGQISLGHGALLAIGGYTVALMMQEHQTSFFLAALVGALLAAVLGLLLGLPAVRLTGPYLAIATLGLAISLPTIGKWAKVFKWTKGSQGIEFSTRLLPKPPSWLPLHGSASAQRSHYEFLLTLGGVLICALVVWNFRRSRTGRAIVALRDSEPAAQVMGINLARYKVLAFMLSAFLAGISGAFLSYQLASVHPDTYSLDLSIAILAMIVIGGLNSLLGSMLGAIFIRWITLNKTILPAPTDIPALGHHLPSRFQTFPTYAAGVYYGLLLILIMLLMPQGLAGAYFRLLHFPYRQRLFRRPPRYAPEGTALPSIPTTTHPAVDIGKEVTRS